MEPFKRSRDPPPKGSDMDQDEDTAFADNYAERDQAKALREQARAGGLRFEAYLTGDQADWLLERIERGMFADPSEAVFAIVKNFIDMEPHHDLRDELLRRILDGSRSEEQTSELQSLMRNSHAVFWLKTTQKKIHTA